MKPRLTALILGSLTLALVSSGCGKQVKRSVTIEENHLLMRSMSVECTLGSLIIKTERGLECRRLYFGNFSKSCDGAAAKLSDSASQVIDYSNFLVSGGPKESVDSRVQKLAAMPNTKFSPENISRVVIHTRHEGNQELSLLQSKYEWLPIELEFLFGNVAFNSAEISCIKSIGVEALKKSAFMTPDETVLGVVTKVHFGLLLRYSLEDVRVHEVISSSTEKSARISAKAIGFGVELKGSAGEKFADRVPLVLNNDNPELLQELRNEITGLSRISVDFEAL